MLTLRFYVSEITRHAGAEYATVKMKPDYKDGANAEWAKYTPSGAIELSVSNPAAIEKLDGWLNSGGKPESLHITIDAVSAD